MNRWLKPGIILGVIVMVWQIVFGALGLYKESSTGWMFSVGAILIQIGVIVWGLMQSAKDGKRFWGQVATGLMISVVAVVFIIVGTFIFTSVFPDAYDYVADQQRDAFARQGIAEDQIEQQVEAWSFTRTPVFSAAMGVLGTMVTGFVVSLITAAFIRKKD